MSKFSEYTFGRRDFNGNNTGCGHRRENGKLALVSHEGGKFKCRLCDTVFDPTYIGEEELTDAILKVHNAIQQLAAFGMFHLTILDHGKDLDKLLSLYEKAVIDQKIATPPYKIQGIPRTNNMKPLDFKSLTYDEVVKRRASESHNKRRISRMK